MLTNGLRCADTDILIRCVRPGVQYVAEGESSDASRVFPLDSSRYRFRIRLTAELTESRH